MRGRGVLVLTILLFAITGFLYSRTHGHRIEIFEISDNTALMMFIEYREATNEGKAVIFCFGDFELLQAFNRETMALFSNLEAYEQNAVRTRMQMSSYKKQIRLKIDWKLKQMEIYLEDKPLTEIPIYFNMNPGDIAGVKRLIFSGSNVFTYSKFLFEPATGRIYTVPHHLASPEVNLEVSYLWAVRVEQEEEDSGKGVIK